MGRLLPKVNCDNMFNTGIMVIFITHLLVTFCHRAQTFIFIIIIIIVRIFFSLDLQNNDHQRRFSVARCTPLLCLLFIRYFFKIYYYLVNFNVTCYINNKINSGKTSKKNQFCYFFWYLFLLTNFIVFKYTCICFNNVVLK